MQLTDCSSTSIVWIGHGRGCRRCRHCSVWLRWLLCCVNGNGNETRNKILDSPAQTGGQAWNQNLVKRKSKQNERHSHGNSDHNRDMIYYYSQRYPFPRKKEGKKQCKTASPAMCYICPLQRSFQIFQTVCSAVPALLVLVLLHQRPPRIHFGRYSA